MVIGLHSTCWICKILLRTVNCMLTYEHNCTYEQFDVCDIACCCEWAVMLAQSPLRSVYLHHFLCSTLTELLSEWGKPLRKVSANSLTSDTGVFSGEQNEMAYSQILLFYPCLSACVPSCTSHLFVGRWSFCKPCI